MDTDERANLTGELLASLDDWNAEDPVTVQCVALDGGLTLSWLLSHLLNRLVVYAACCRDSECPAQAGHLETSDLGHGPRRRRQRLEIGCSGDAEGVVWRRRRRRTGVWTLGVCIRNI